MEIGRKVWTEKNLERGRNTTNSRWTEIWTRSLPNRKHEYLKLDYNDR